MTSQSIPVAGSGRHERVPLRLRLAQRGIDGVTLLVLPAALFILLLFVYPFLYGMNLSVHPKGGARPSVASPITRAFSPNPSSTTPFSPRCGSPCR